MVELQFENIKFVWFFLNVSRQSNEEPICNRTSKVTSNVITYILTVVISDYYV